MIGFCADLHFGSKNNHKETFEEQMSFFEKQFFPFIKNNGISNVCSLGDFTDSRIQISWYILQELRERFFKWFDDNNIIFHHVIGNHDLLYKDRTTHHSLKNFLGEFNNIKVYDEVTTLKIKPYVFGIVPWTNNDNIVYPKADILLLHGEFKGFNMSKGIECKNGLEVKSFKDYQLVLSGHFHLIQEQGNFKYLGNPYQKDWGDFGEQKGFWILDDNFNMLHIQNEISPRFLKIIYEDDKIYVEGE